MTALVAGLFLFALALALWSYLGYPVLLHRLAARVPPEAPAGGPEPDVEVLVAAADEETVIAERVSDLLAQRVGGGYRVSIGCDGSRDRTPERARRAAASDARARVTEFEGRRGKASVLNDLVAAAEAPVLVFTDANTRFEPHAVARLAAAFRTPSVGAACGRLVLEASGGARSPEIAFWERETALKEAEGRLGICLGANGAIYAARRELVDPLPADTALDDFLIPVRIAAKGWRSVFVSDAVAHEQLPARTAGEIARRFRIGIGAGQVLRRERFLFRERRHPLLTLAFCSRKVARWLAPVFALGSALVALGSPTLRPAGLAFLGIAALCLAASLLPARPAGLAGRLYYFAVINLALSAGVLFGLLGGRRPVWTPRRATGQDGTAG